MITHHTQLLNALIEKYGYKSYLEIGVQNPANNFERVKCERRAGVDPALQGYADADGSTVFGLFSDEFFSTNTEVFDLIFIDGDHTKEQVKRDFENSLRCLSPHGRIVIHDVLPELESTTIVPRQTKVWHGDVYKWALTIQTYENIRVKTFWIDNGCMVVWKEAHNGWAVIDKEITWESYLYNRKEWMNVTDVVEI